MFEFKLSVIQFMGRVQQIMHIYLEVMCLLLMECSAYRDINYTNNHTLSTHYLYICLMHRQYIFKQVKVCTFLHTFTCDIKNAAYTYAESERKVRKLSLLQMPRLLLLMFATICAHCQPANAVQFWETHKHEMIESYQEEDLEGLEKCSFAYSQQHFNGKRHQLFSYLSSIITRQARVCNFNLTFSS